MNNNQLEVNVSLTNQKVQFTGVSRSNPERPITLDFMPPIGDGQGYRGLELLLMSFAGCVSTAMVCLLRRMGKDISGFEVIAKEIKSEQPFTLQKISLEVILESKDAADSDLQTVIRQAEEISPVWKMLKDKVEVDTEYRIIAIPD